MATLEQTPKLRRKNVGQLGAFLSIARRADALQVVHLVCAAFAQGVQMVDFVLAGIGRPEAQRYATVNANPLSLVPQNRYFSSSERVIAPASGPPPQLIGAHLHPIVVAPHLLLRQESGFVFCNMTLLGFGLNLLRFLGIGQAPPLRTFVVGDPVSFYVSPAQLFHPFAIGLPVRPAFGLVRHNGLSREKSILRFALSATASLASLLQSILAAGMFAKLIDWLFRLAPVACFAHNSLLFNYVNIQNNG